MIFYMILLYEQNRRIKMTVSIDTGWIEFITGGPEGFADIFMYEHCGHWLRGIKHDPKLGFLAYDFAENEDHNEYHLTKAERDAAIKSWLTGEKLPENFYALNLDVASKSWQEGVKKDGIDWYAEGDGNTYDCAVQIALLGEITYC
jgi:hypothetical protein